jgi:hypothetical protein
VNDGGNVSHEVGEDKHAGKHDDQEHDYSKRLRWLDVSVSNSFYNSDRPVKRKQVPSAGRGVHESSVCAVKYRGAGKPTAEHPEAYVNKIKSACGARNAWDASPAGVSVIQCSGKVAGHVLQRKWRERGAATYRQHAMMWTVRKKTTTKEIPRKTACDMPTDDLKLEAVRVTRFNRMNLMRRSRRINLNRRGTVKM